MKFLILSKNNIIKTLVVCICFLMLFLSFLIVSPKSIVVFASRICKDNDARISYLKSYGWETEKEPYEVTNMIIPIKFSDELNNYNELQKKQGFDLTQYLGVTAKKYTYKVTNYPKHENAFITLYIYNDNVIAADVYTPDINGIMHGLSYEE